MGTRQIGHVAGSTIGGVADSGIKEVESDGAG